MNPIFLYPGGGQRAPPGGWVSSGTPTGPVVTGYPIAMQQQPETMTTVIHTGSLRRAAEGDAGQQTVAVPAVADAAAHPEGVGAGERAAGATAPQAESGAAVELLPLGRGGNNAAEGPK